MPRPVRRAYRAIEQSVRQRAGAEHFLGVTVQPMVEHDGYELIVGCSPDPQFGPVLLFGAGGQQVELIRDRTLGLPPLNTTLARRMMEHTRIFQFLQGIRGGHPPVDLGALERLLVRFSGLVVEQPRIKEIDINPLLASPGRLIALDARVVLHGAEVDADQLPRPAIRPYPTQYVVPWTTPNGLRRHNPPDPARGRAAGGAIPREAVGGFRLPALLPGLEAEPARCPRAADPSLLRRF